MNREELFIRLVENYQKAKPNVTKEEAERHVTKVLNERDKLTSSLKSQDQSYQSQQKPVTNAKLSPPPKSANFTLTAANVWTDHSKTVAHTEIKHEPRHNPIITKTYSAMDIKTSDSPISIYLQPKSTPKQVQVVATMNELQKRITALIATKDAGLLTPDGARKLIQLQAILKSKEQLLRRLRSEAQRQRKRRSILKTRIAKLAEEHPELRMFSRERSGKALEGSQPQLFEAVGLTGMDSSPASSTNSQCSQSNNTSASGSVGGGGGGGGAVSTTSVASTSDLNSTHLAYSNNCLNNNNNSPPGGSRRQAINNLNASLTKRGFVLSRNATYLRLQSRRGQRQGGKVSVRTVPVKLVGAELEAKHVDTDFAFASYGYVNEICALFGSNKCAFMSVDDTARVVLGLAAAKPKAPILMHMEYKVRPTYQAVLADKRKLIPSVYAVCEMKSSPGDTSFSGPTYIAVRSGKEASTNALTHARDFRRLLELDTFRRVLHDDAGAVKPILILSVDGGPYESPRFAQTLAVGVDRFRSHNLDVYISLSHAPGYSAYNTVERRLAPMSRQLYGLILPHNAYGLHMDEAGRTVDPVLEATNFSKAGETLAEVLSALVLDDHPVCAEFVPADASQAFVGEASPEWIHRHVRQSQYMLQIVRCENQACCGPWRTNWRQFLPERFLPPPFPLRQSASGLRIPEPHDPEALLTPFASLIQRLALKCLRPKVADDPKFRPEVPYDLFCPSVLAQLPERVCQTCGAYCPTPASARRHFGLHRPGGIKEEPGACAPGQTGPGPGQPAAFESEFLPGAGPGPGQVGENGEGLPVFRSIIQLMQSPWTTDHEMV